MKNLLLLLFFLASLSVHSQVLDEFFLNTPDTLLPYFKKDSRELLLKFTEENKDTLSSQPNEIGGKVWLSHKSDDLIVVHTSSMSEIEYAIVPTSTDTLFCVIKTEYAPEAESSVYIYNKVWELQKIIDLSKYARIEFPNTISQSERDELSGMIEMKMYSARVLPDNSGLLEISQNLPNLSKEEKLRFKPCKLQINVKMVDIL